MPYRLLEFDFMLLTFLSIWDDLIESEGIDGNLWALHTRRYEPMKEGMMYVWMDEWIDGWIG